MNKTHPPSYDSAAKHLARFASKSSGDPPTPKQLIKLLVDIDHLASLDLKACRTNQQKQKVYAVMPAAVTHVLNCVRPDSEKPKSTASKELYDALANLALGTPKDDRLKKAPISSESSLDQNKIKAAIIVACEKFPDSKAHIIRRGSDLLDLSEDQVNKFLENFEGERIKSRTLANLVASYREHAEAGEAWPFDDLLPTLNTD